MTARACTVSLLAVIALGLPLRASGADAPCVADVQKLCADVAAGQGRIQACLKQHESQLSEACRNKIDVLAQEVKELAVVCRFDIGRFCSDVSPGAGRLASCLNSNASDLSPQCKDVLSSVKK
jgi:hypothetical protein